MRVGRWWIGAVLAGTFACGRAGFGPLGESPDAPPADAGAGPVDAAPDADAPGGADDAMTAGGDATGGLCPTDMALIVGMMETFCIDVAEQAAALPQAAAETACAGSGRRLCSSPEWQDACAANPGGALVGMTDGWEWSGDVLGQNGRIVGSGSCTITANIDRSQPARFRCCRLPG